MNRRAQEEAVGFVAIIVITAIALVFFIGMYLKDNGEVTATKSVEIKQFLEASYRYTTDCQTSLSQKYSNMGDLLKSCYQNQQSMCFDGRNTCDVYNATMQSLLNSSFVVGPTFAIKAYVFNSTYTSGNIEYDIMHVEKGNCSGSYKTEEYLSPDILTKGTYSISLRLCS